MNHFLSHIVRRSMAGLAVAAAALLGSCINDYDTCPLPGGESDVVTFSFQMVSSSIGPSRALDSGGHDESSSEWPEFEDLIKENDFAFYIFAQSTDGSWPMIMSMTDLATADKANQAHMTIKGFSGIWMITAAIAKTTLEEKLGYAISPGSNQPVKLRVAVIANAGADAGTGTGSANYNAYIADDFTQFITRANNLRFNLSNIYSSNEGDAEANGIYKGAIPMYGMNEFTVAADQLHYSNSQDPAWMGSVDMLRALAKLRVVDNIVNKDPLTHLPRIEAISVESATPQSYVLPANAANFMGVQTDIPRPLIPTGGNSIIKLGRTSTYAADSARIGYLPEQNITSTAPVISITVTFEVDAQLRPVRQEVYQVPLQGYNGVDFTAKLGSALLRNHIYTLSVNSVGLGTEADIQVEASDWEPSEFELDFSQNVNVSSKMQWNDGFASDSNGEIVMLPWTTTADGEDVAVPLRGTFGINTPVGATWTAYLIAIGENANDSAFEFIVKDEEGNDVRSPFATGVIDGENAMNLRIVSTDPQPTQVNKALLQVVVTIGEGTNSVVMEADLTPEGSSFKNYTIVQDI